MKPLFLSMLLSVSSLSAQAETLPTLLTVWAKDGSSQSFALAQIPEVSFTESTLQVVTDGVEVDFPLDDLLRFTYDEAEVTGVTHIDTGAKSFEIRDEAVYFPSLQAGTIVRIYGMNGQNVLLRRITEAGAYLFSLTDLQPGTYLVNVNGITTKIMKR